MATGLPPKMVSMDMKFLLQIDKLRTWPLYLTEKGYLPTTVRNMMTNVTLFIRHMKCSFQAVSKVRSPDFDKLLYELKMLQTNVHKHVVVHRQKVMKKKTDQLLEAKKEVTFMKAAKKKIPELLQFLPADGSFGKEHCQLMGYLMGYLSILTGHRAVVFTNMTHDQVMSADCWGGGKKYRVMVDEHKTTSSFGQAAVCLNKMEFEWLKKVACGDCCLGEEDNKYIFHTILGRNIVKPSLFLHMAWVNAGLTGPVNFVQIRSSVSTQAKNHLTEKERKEVAHAMCHDPTTAEKFYVALPDKEMAYQIRKLRMKALKEAFAKSSQVNNDTDDSSSLTDDKSEDTPETSSDDEEVIFDDAPESSSSLSSDEKLTLMNRRNKRLYGISEPEDESSEDEPPEDEPPYFPAPSSQKSKKNLDFSTDSSVQKRMSHLVVVSPSKCFVSVERMKRSFENFYLNKRKAKFRRLEEGGRAQKLKSTFKKSRLPPLGGREEILETPVEEGVGRGEILEALVEDTPLPPRGGGEEIPETLVEEEVGRGQIVKTLVEETPLPPRGVEEEIPETPVEEGGGEEEMPETLFEEEVGWWAFLEAQVEETPLPPGGEEEIPETPVEDMPETPVINSCAVEDSGNLN